MGLSVSPFQSAPCSCQGFRPHFLSLSFIRRIAHFSLENIFQKSEIFKMQTQKWKNFWEPLAQAQSRPTNPGTPYLPLVSLQWSTFLCLIFSTFFLIRARRKSKTYFYRFISPAQVLLKSKPEFEIIAIHYNFVVTQKQALYFLSTFFHRHRESFL